VKYTRRHENDTTARGEIGGSPRRRGYVDRTGWLTLEVRLRAHGGCSVHRALSAASVSGGDGVGHNVTVDSAT
jgi:hypothetical protein